MSDPMNCGKQESPMSIVMMNLAETANRLQSLLGVLHDRLDPFSAPPAVQANCTAPPSPPEAGDSERVMALRERVMVLGNMCEGVEARLRRREL